MTTRRGLVGRDDELRLLGDALARCAMGAGGVVLVSGEAGIGKTALVEHATASWDGDVIRAAAVPGGAAYAPLVGLVPAAGRLPYAEPSRYFCQFLVARAESAPTVLLLEDLHWADAATLELLPALAEAGAAHRLLVLGTYRSDELPRTHPLRPVRIELRRRGRLTDLALRPLTLENTRQLLAGILRAAPAPDLVSAVHARADGLPFFVEELAHALQEANALRSGDEGTELATDTVLPLPDTVLDAVLVRTTHEREEHPEATEYAAVLGEHVDLPALQELVGTEEVDALLDAGLLLEVEADTAAFRHALVRDALHRSIPWARRRARHARAAEVLAERGAAPGTVAEHWLAAQEPGRARPLLLESAERHCAAHAYRDAAEAARRALALWPADDDPAERLALQERLAECAEMSGEHAEAVRTWTEVAAAHEETGDAGRAARVHRRAANAAEMAGEPARAAAERLLAATAFAEAGEPGEAAVERLALAHKQKAAGRLTEALEHAAAATRAAEACGRKDLVALCLAFEGAARSSAGDGARGVELARRGVELALAERLDEVAGEVYYELAGSLEYAADYAAAVSAYESAVDLCRRHGSREQADICFVCTSPVTRLMGDWDRALEICAEVLADDDTQLLVRRVAEEESGLIAALRGDRRTARPRVRRAAEFGKQNGVFGLEVGARWGLAVVATLDDDPEAALRAVGDLLDRCSAVEECHYALPALRWASTLLARAEQGDRLTQAHRIVAGLATRNASPKVLSTLAHVGAELAVLEGDAAQAEKLFGRSLELLSGITAPYEQAHTGLRWGEVAGTLGRRDEAVERIATAYRTAHRLGAKPLATRCASALDELGEQVDRRLGRLAARALEPAGLTRREREVLRHLAEGRTNREIAAQLFLSTRTVDMHVRNVLDKLGCSSRTAAVRRATERGLVGT